MNFRRTKMSITCLTLELQDSTFHTFINKKSYFERFYVQYGLNHFNGYNKMGFFIFRANNIKLSQNAKDLLGQGSIEEEACI